MMESPGLSQVDIAKKAGWMNAHGEAQRHRARQAQERLVRHGLLAQDREGLHLTEKGKKTAQRIVKQRQSSI
jgi:ribosomal protein S19E (S16A)